MSCNLSLVTCDYFGNTIMKNILVVNVNWIGDVIFSTPVFRALRAHYPGARICCMAVPRVVPVLKSCPYVDDIIVYDERGEHRWLWGKLKLIASLRRFHFDIAFLLHRSWTRAFLMFCAGIPERVGYDLKNLGHLLTRRVNLPEGDIHRSDYYLRVIESYGVKVEDRTTEIVPAQEVRDDIEKILAAQGILRNDFLAVVNTGGNWDLKRWPKENFAQLVGRMIKELKMAVVISGAVKDKETADYVRLASQTDPVILAGQTSLEQTFALMKRADVVVSSDSGPMHIASSVGSSVIAIFGPTRPEDTGPRGKGQAIILRKDLDCNQAACYQLDCPDNRCMKAVSVDEVFAAVAVVYAQQLNRNKV